MNIMNWIKGFTALGLGLVAASSMARAQTRPAVPIPRQDPATTPPAAIAPDPAAPAAEPTTALQPAARMPLPARNDQGIEISRLPGDLPGPIDTLQDVQDTGKLLFMLADEDHDGLISKREAVDAGNLMVGGFFFRADANGDGVLSRDEAQQAREGTLRRNPILKFVLQRARDPKQANLAGTQAVNTLGQLLDGNNDKQIQASELRQAVNTAVDGVYAVADTNRDDRMSPTEINAAMYGLVRAAAQAAFQQADADNSGALSKDEFAKAMVEPANTVFDVLDANLDGQLTPQELRRAARVIVSQVRALEVPDASNSIDKLIESGRLPSEVSPVPNINATPTPSSTAPSQPAATRRP